MPSKHSAFGRGARPLKCRQCHTPRTPDVPISARGLCGGCANERMLDQATAQRECEPEYMDVWVRRYVEGVREYARTLISN